MPFTITDLRGDSFALPDESFSTYRVNQIVKLLVTLKDRVDPARLIHEVALFSLAKPNNEPSNSSLERLTAIPTLMDFAPEPLLQIAALCVISNQEVVNAFRSGTLDELRSQREQWLEFEFDASVLIRLLGYAMQKVGLSLSKKEFQPLSEFRFVFPDTHGLVA